MRPKHHSVLDGTYLITFRCVGNSELFSVSHHCLEFRSVLRNKSIELAFKVYAYVIMPDHVHILLNVGHNHTLPKIMNHIKGASARSINQSHGLVGQPFWQDGFFDSNIVSQKRLIHSINYIHQNPVGSGLCETPEQYRFSSAGIFAEIQQSPTAILDEGDNKVGQYVDLAANRFIQ